MSDQSSKMSGLSRRRFLSVVGSAAAAPALAGVAPVVNASQAKPLDVLALNDAVDVRTAYTWLAGSTVNEAQRFISADKMLSQGSEYLDGRELRVSIEGLFNAEQWDSDELSLDISHPYFTHEAGVIHHTVWTDGSGVAEFTHVPDLDNPLVLDVTVRQKVQSARGLAQRVLSGSAEDATNTRTYTTQFRLVTNQQESGAMMLPGHYVFGVPGVSHDQDFAGAACDFQTDTHCGGDVLGAGMTGLQASTDVPCFMISVRDA